MTKERHPHGSAAAQTAALPGAKAATGTSVLFGTLSSRLADLADWFLRKRQQRRTARELAKLSDHALRDIGLRRGDVAAVSRNPDRFRRHRRATD